MTLPEIETFLTQNRIAVATIMRAIGEPGWRLSLRARPGSILHDPTAHGSEDGFRSFVAPTLAAGWALAAAAATPAAPDPLEAFG